MADLAFAAVLNRATTLSDRTQANEDRNSLLGMRGRDIATNIAPMSAALSKRLLWDTAINGYTPQQVASLETQLHHRVMGTDDAREGVNAYLERRAPRFSARLSAEWSPLPDPE